VSLLFILLKKCKENGFLYEKLIFSYKKPFGVHRKQGDNVQLHFYAMI
jgi:hypothetical protein